MYLWKREKKSYSGLLLRPIKTFSHQFFGVYIIRCDENFDGKFMRWWSTVLCVYSICLKLNDEILQDCWL